MNTRLLFVQERLWGRINDQAQGIKSELSFGGQLVCSINRNPQSAIISEQSAISNQQ
jgi:hypothetical protein